MNISFQQALTCKRESSYNANCRPTRTGSKMMLHNPKHTMTDIATEIRYLQLSCHAVSALDHICRSLRVNELADALGIHMQSSSSLMMTFRLSWKSKPPVPKFATLLQSHFAEQFTIGSSMNICESMSVNIQRCLASKHLLVLLKPLAPFTDGIHHTGGL